ncbi:hypothetical protein [Aminobacter sp. MDW-2]|uniref:hypothetical protein n=1 Tax=Aminobacter sp. MDW-2 TaxID=2666139 RepID=UPI0012B0228A|nr:hypothetical protein [Aminobacter sp. MDW-2]MRX32833.1 hypothetical protein [Aminobacter sp. MDW-2]QNH34510.1 hypothetical protein H5P29_00710 [Aminobacter sp. MDW-2]
MAKAKKYPDGPGNNHQTPYSAIPALLPHLHGIRRFAEPCQGEGKLVRWLEYHGLECAYRGDIITGQDAMEVPFDLFPIDAIISNFPWERAILHPLIERCMQFAPTWLLFDTDWAFSQAATPLMPHCSHIVTVGRLRWVPGTRHGAMDYCAWYRFHAQHVDGPRLIPARTDNLDHNYEPALVDL